MFALSDLFYEIAIILIYFVQVTTDSDHDHISTFFDGNCTFWKPTPLEYIIYSWSDTQRVCSGAPGAEYYCGEIPNYILRCLNSPSVVSADVSSKCVEATNDCDKINCIFRESKWLNGAAVDKTKVAAYFDQYQIQHPEWAPAVQHMKAACLGTVVLKPQGVYLNCPAYDIMQCVLHSFITNATPTQWSTSAECTQARAFASFCPFCPSDCFADQIPIGSCNACLSLPRSP